MQAVEKIPDESEAIDRALSLAQKDDLVCIMSGRVEQVIQHLYAFQEKEGARTIVHTGPR